MILSIWTYIGWTVLVIVGLLLLTFLISNIKLRIVQSKQRRLLRDIFNRHNMAAPDLKFGSVYWWPTFTLTFESESEYNKAKGRQIFEEFENGIVKFYNKEYDPKQGVKFTYRGQP